MSLRDGIKQELADSLSPLYAGKQKGKKGKKPIRRIYFPQFVIQ
jgi:hypothetical protein